MDERPDGRKYSRVARRSRIILESLKPDTKIDLGAAVDSVLAKGGDDFYQARYDKTLSEERLRVYFRYLKHIDALTLEEKTVQRSFPSYRSDSQWAQALADAARRALAGTVNWSFGDVPKKLKENTLKLLKRGTPPTVPSLIQEISGATGQDAEFLRWDIYLVCDGPNSALEIRRFPTLWAE